MATNLVNTASFLFNRNQVSSASQGDKANEALDASSEHYDVPQGPTYRVTHLENWIFSNIS